MADYFELGKLFGKSYSPAVEAARVGSETSGKIAQERTKQINKRRLYELATNLAIVGLDQYEGHQRSSRIAKYAEDKGFEGYYDYWDNFFSRPTYTKDGVEYSEADIEARKRYNIDVKKILGVD